MAKNCPDALKHNFLFHCKLVPMLLLGGHRSVHKIGPNMGRKGPRFTPSWPSLGPFGGAQRAPKGLKSSQVGRTAARSGPNWPEAGPSRPQGPLLVPSWGPKRPPQELPKGPQESPQRGSKSSMNLRRYPMTIFFAFVRYLETRPEANNCSFP